MKSALPPILMVDDEPNMRSTVSELLMDDGYTVDVAESGEQAVEMLAEPSSCLLYTSPSPRDATLSRMPSSA